MEKKKSSRIAYTFEIEVNIEKADEMNLMCVFEYPKFYSSFFSFTFRFIIFRYMHFVIEMYIQIAHVHTLINKSNCWIEFTYRLNINQLDSVH